MVDPALAVQNAVSITVGLTCKRLGLKHLIYEKLPDHAGFSAHPSVVAAVTEARRLLRDFGYVVDLDVFLMDQLAPERH